MSATNRGGKRSEADFYPTPGWCVHRLLEAVELPGGCWMEPAAGDGAIIDAVRENRSDVKWLVSELRHDCRNQLLRRVGKRNLREGDFLSLEPKSVRRDVSVVITNPPFSLALPMIQHSLKFGAQAVVMLLRLNFLGSRERSDFMRTHAPDIFVLPNRPSFSGRGTDSIEYAWFVWHGSERRRSGVVQVLAETDPEVRRLSSPIRLVDENRSTG